ncbi:2-oxoacid:ferredoxin oxidoreductase subunit alpha [Clostridium acetobutylicum]|nr:2-oxoacid:ferredoxin oxidoreductase subunit alpha [Clostridium acetobutylicum]
MIYNILIGGAAGQGMETLAAILQKILKKKGFEIFTTQDYMSRVRGGHNFFQIRFGNEEIRTHVKEIDGIIALDLSTIELHINELKKDGFVICDNSIKYEDKRVYALPLRDIAHKIGNVRVYGSVALGALLKLFNQDLAFAFDVLNVRFKEDIAQKNFNAFEEGFKKVVPKYDIKPKEKDDKLLINANQAIALGALAAGCKFYSAYPMTPSTSIMDYLASKMKEAGIVVEQAEDEIAAINMAIGASFTGTRAMTGTSGGGFALMVEAIGLSSMLEVPIVVAEIQRPGPTTGLPTRTEQGDLKFVISSSPGDVPKMVIALKNAEDAFYQTMRAFNIADKYQIPVIILGDQYIADNNRTVREFDFDKIKVNRYLSDEDFKGNREYKRYEVTKTGVSPRIIPGNIEGKTVLVDSDEHDEYGHITESSETRVLMNDKRIRKMKHLKEELIEPEYFGEDAAENILIGWGSLEGAIKEAVNDLNKEGKEKYAALIFGDVWPLPEKLLREKASKAKTLIDVEQNAQGQLADIIREGTGIEVDKKILKYDGRPIIASYIVERIKEGE